MREVFGGWAGEGFGLSIMLNICLSISIIHRGTEPTPTLF
jgi:hypothetical protein